MKKFNFFLILNLIFVMLTSCGTIKEGFSMQKKDNSDEFLVEKKSPLIMPPNFDELPVPKTMNNSADNKENTIKQLISKQDSETTKTINNGELSNNLEKSLIEKITKN